MAAKMYWLDQLYIFGQKASYKSNKYQNMGGVKMEQYIKIDKNLLKEVENITDVDYEYKNDMVPISSIAYMLKDLVYENNLKSREIKEIKEDIDERYELKPFDPYDEYDLAREDFV